jgi:chemosensory pili system protein ChpA (sensor histidine kinase/response regulator)
MSATQDYVALDWIKGEITQTLERAQYALEAVAESPEDSSSMRSCLTAIHQAHGTLKMVELEGPTRVASEMEALAQALMNSAVPDEAKAQEILMQVILQMPVYLDRIQREQQDTLEFVIPAINNLRIARGEAKLEGARGGDEPGLNPLFVVQPSTEVRATFEKQKGRQHARKIRQRYQQALIALLKKDKPRENLNLMGKAFAMLIKMSGVSAKGNFFRLALAAVEGINAGAIKLDSASAEKFKRIDSELKDLASNGADSLGQVSAELGSDLLALVHAAKTETPRIAAVKSLFSKESIKDLNTEDINFGPDDETLSAVSKIIIEELHGVTDKLDLFVRSTEQDAAAIYELVPQLEQIASTLTVVGMADHQASILSQVEIIKQLESQAAEPNENQLLEMAGAFLKIESALSLVVDDGEGGPDGDRFGDLNEAMASVIRETRNTLAICKDQVIDFISSDFEPSKLQAVPDNLRSLGGGLSIINQQRSCDIFNSAADYVKKELIDAQHRPDLSQMDELADAITSVDYYLERLLESSSEPYLQMIEVAEAAVAKLGYAVDRVVAEGSLSESAVEEVGAEIPDVAQENTDTEVSGELVDDEILEIFIEEAEEVLENIREHLPMWRSNPADSLSLMEVKRAFHTLKGSGRMVGATVIGEFARSVENMLNRVIDNSIAADANLFVLLDAFVARIPGGIETFKEGRQHEFFFADLVAQAEAISSGEVAQIEGSGLPSDAGLESVDTLTVDPELVELVLEATGTELEMTESEAELLAALESDLIGAASDEDFTLEGLDEETFSNDALLLDEEGLEALSLDVDSLDVDSLEEDGVEEDSPEKQSHVSDADLGFQVASTADDVAATPESIWDPELDEIFVAEAHEKIALIKSYATSESVFSPDVIAAFHTLKGSAGMAGVASIARIAAPMEKWSSDLFLSSSVPPDEFLRSVKQSIEMMEACLGSLESFRVEMPGVDEFVAGLEQTSVSNSSEVVLMFDFKNIRVLSKPVEILDRWDANEIDAIVGELENARSQALEFEQVDLFQLVSALLYTYENLSAQPNSEILSILVAAHEQLILMFDSIAASQVVSPAKEIVLALESIDFGALELAQEQINLVDECRELLVTLDRFLQTWSQDINDAMPLVQLKNTLEDLSGKVEKPEIRVIVITIEPMVQLCELIGSADLVANEDDLRLLESGLRSVEHLLEAYQAGVLLEEDAVLLEEFRNRLETPAQVLPSLENDETSQAQLGEEPSIESESLSSILDATIMIVLPADDIDADVLALFLEEAGELIEGIDLSILDWSENPTASTFLDNILRHLHTMKGGARLAGLNSLGEYAHNFETDLIGLQTRPVELDDDFFASLNETQDEITRRISVYVRYAEGAVTEAEMLLMQQAKAIVLGEPSNLLSVVPDIDSELPTGQIDATKNASSELPGNSQLDDGLPEDNVDMEILAIFIEEAEELLESLDQSILDWSNKASDQTYLDNLLRHLHTLKGGARLAGLNSLGEYSHNLESFLIGVQQHPVELDDEFFALLNRHQDEITRRVAIYKKMLEGTAEADEMSSLSNNEAFSSGRHEDRLSVPQPGSAQKEQASATSYATSYAAPDAAPHSAPHSVPKTPAATQEMVRVSAELLEELVSLAGETSITRGRIEQQISDFGESLQEMEETIVRIREQVRRLEIEAESRETMFRSQVKGGEAGFDELELDRYTMLQEISRSLSEGSSDMMDLKDTLLNKSRDAETLLHQQARLGSELQEGLTRTRMVPFARLIPRLRRIVRQISSEVGKSVRFDAFNVEGELDRSVLERIVAPLEHMLRNAVDHGIETKEERIRIGKPETGRISLRLSREGGYVVLAVSDDGGGIDVETVKKKAIERGLIKSPGQVTDHEAMQFIINAGFSTAKKLTQISGRGVGMDVVNSEIKQLGGSLTIDSTFSVGTEFSIRIPFTVSINRALMVVIQEETYAVPLNTIEGIVRVSPYELEAYYQPDAPMFEYAGQPYRLTYMGKLLSKSENPTLEGQTSPLPVILARSGDLSVAIQVDKVIGSREVVVKSLGRQFDEVGGISGATVLGDGSVVVILDVLALVQRADADTQDFVVDELLPVDTDVKTVLIVDDSVTVRKVTSRLMERQGWVVVTAKDGLDAVEQLQDFYPDIVLLDIEMPKMDGFEVLRTVRRDERLKDLPIIMITSRTGEKHKQQALELGVNSYLGKPFQEAGLMSTIEEVLAQVNK